MNGEYGPSESDLTNSREEAMPGEETGVTTVEKFVQENLVPTKVGRRCVDGRYESDSEESGTTARPGGDFGYVMALLAQNDSLGLGLTPEESAEKIYLAVTSDGTDFSMHTDHHASFPNQEGETSAIGCGHIAKALNPTTNSGYEASSEDVQRALNQIRGKVLVRGRIHLAVLEGEHAEKGVLIVTGTKVTVNPSNGESMYFVYDQTRDHEYMKDLVARMNIPGLTAEEFIEASNQQLGATLKNLASGLPQFLINADSGISVQSAGRVS